MRYVDPNGQSPVGALVVMITVDAVIQNMPSKEEHYNRNDYQKNETYLRLEDALKNGYRRLGLEQGEDNAEKLDKYHEMGKLPENYPDPSGNNKYVKEDKEHPGATFELIFDSNGDLVTDSTNGGTYNFSNPDGLKGGINHFIKDMLPYYLYGNSPEDKKTTTILNRIVGDYKGQIPDPTPKENN